MTSTALGLRATFAGATLATFTSLLACEEGDDGGGAAGATASDGSELGSGGSENLGGATSSGGAGTGGAAPELSGPIERGEQLVLEFGELYFATQPSFGGRVVSLRQGDTDILLGASAGSNRGSTFWTSPQSDWEWPPPGAIDEGAYQPTIAGSMILLQSSDASFSGKSVAVRKRFSMDFLREAIVLQYTLVNTGSEAISLAGWEVSRVPSGGLVFFPTGQTSSTPLGASELPVVRAEGVTWFDGAAHPPDGSAKKLHADGREGWLAHVSGGVLFLKLFEDLEPQEQAPGEGEVEIFAQSGGDGGYVEVENQGRYSSIAPGGTSDYQVTWIVRRLPSDVETRVGSTSLLDFVREQLPTGR